MVACGHSISLASNRQRGIYAGGGEAVRIFLARLLLASLALLVALSAPMSSGRAESADLVVDTAGGEVRFTVELVDTPETRSRGLMFRTELPAGHGMLFDFKEDQHVAFWMRNTLIPLDMVFIDSRGRIARIHERARPHDETAIPSVMPVQAVLEIAGGEARRLGLTVGDTVRHPIFER
jgi:uncharacterized protein